MPVALPSYLGTAFDQCPPGHRFGLYFDAWETDWRKPANKTLAFRKVAEAFPEHSRKAAAALRARQLATAEAIGEAVLIYPARLIAPLPTGLGNEHPLENGFAFLNPYGLPYLAGSGVKGVLRRAAEELASGEWGDSAGWDQTAINALFGLEDPTEFRRGALAFWDLFFAPPKKDAPLLKVEIMTPHHSGYLQESGSPHANESPTPIPFLALAAGCEATLFVHCDPALIPAEQSSLRSSWKPLIESALAHAGEWLGFGAKTAVGYGRMAEDRAAREQIGKRADERNKAAEKALHDEEEARKIAEMAPWQQTREQVLKEKPKDQKDFDALLKALEAKRWSDAAEVQRIADEVVGLLKDAAQWREKSEKKNPAKDEPFQRTLRIKKFLG